MMGTESDDCGSGGPIILASDAHPSAHQVVQLWLLVVVEFKVNIGCARGCGYTDPIREAEHVSAVPGVAGLI